MDAETRASDQGIFPARAAKGRNKCRDQKHKNDYLLQAAPAMLQRILSKVFRDITILAITAILAIMAISEV
jgi:hypothetical protein